MILKKEQNTIEENKKTENNKTNETNKKTKKHLAPTFIKKIPTGIENKDYIYEYKYPVLNSQFISATNFLIREPVFSSSNNCLYKAIIINLEISSYFHYELRQFISVYIDEN